MTTQLDDPRHRAGRAMRVGAILFVVSVGIVCLPLLLGGNPFNKYFVAFGLVAAFLGLGWLTNGAIDLLRRRDR